MNFSKFPSGNFHRSYQTMLALSHLAVEIVVDKSYMKWHRLWYSNEAKSAPAQFGKWREAVCGEF